MRILLLTQVVPFPPDSGPKIKTYNVLRYLALHHDVHLVSFARSAQEEAHAQMLRRYCQDVTTVPLRRSRVRDAAALATSLLNGRPFLVERDDSRGMRAAIADQLARFSFDAVHADQLSMAQFAIDLPLPLRVLDEHNAVWTIVRRSGASSPWGPIRWLAALEWRKLRRYEWDICQDFDQLTVVSPEDLVGLRDPARPEPAARVIPIAVDTEELAFSPPTAESRDVLSVATMFYPPNVEAIHWFATDIFPLVRQALPHTTFRIVGSRPPPKITALATPDSGIVVTGYVPDLSEVLRQSGVLIVPLKSGSGMRVKILEAFSRGIPVVSTTIGVEGIDARAGEHLLVADDAAGFARAVVQVLEDRALAERLARNGRRLVEERYDWQTALAELDAIYGADSIGDSAAPSDRRLSTADAS
jgi:glycosyltransferase involved in cell wall biosynthesis